LRVEERLESDECWNDAGAEAMRDDECEGYQDDADVEEAVTDSPVAGSDAAEVVSFTCLSLHFDTEVCLSRCCAKELSLLILGLLFVM
jgi:hypothetical protein